MLKPICVKDQRFYRMKKSGYYFTEMMPKSGNPLPGTLEPENWQPYKIWAGDLWECPDCGAETIVGTGRGPISEHYFDDFNDVVSCLSADQLKVNDC
jgi:hypothetical protein